MKRAVCALFLTVTLLICGVSVVADDDFGGTLIARLQDGKVEVYRLDHETDCFVVIGELHGKTVSGFCK